MERQVGLSTTDHCTEFEQFFQSCKEGGVHVCELSAKKETYDSLVPSEIVSLAKKYDVTVRSLHLPFGGELTICNRNENNRNYTLEVHKKLIKDYSELGVHYFVVHPSGEPIAQEVRLEEMKNSKESLKELAEYALQFSSTILIEDLPRDCLGNTIKEMKELLSAHEALGVTFDTNHLMSGELQDEFVYALADKIKSLHISDYDFINERHWVPGEGKIDWVKFMDALDTVGYSGPLMYEICLLVEAKTTIIRRKLTALDFIDNARSLVLREKPIIIGEPRKNLGMWGPIDG